MTYAGQPQLLKKYNSDLIEQLIVEHGTMTKPELAALSNLSLPTVNKLVDELVSLGKLTTGESRTASGAGRPARTYAINGNYGAVITVKYDAGIWLGTSLSLSGVPHATAQCPARGNSVEEISSVISELEKAAENVLEIGISIPGIVLADGTITSIPAVASLDGVNLEKELTDRFGIRVMTENDVKLMTLGYYRTEMKHADNIAFIYAKERIGAGLIISGQLFRSSGSFAGEFGYIPVSLDESGDMHYRNGGSLETALALARQKNDVDMIYRILTHMVSTCVSVVNPEAVVIYTEDDALDTERIARGVSRYIPSYGIPAIVKPGSCDYEIKGLYEMAMEKQKSRCWLLDEVESRVKEHYE